jgi:hypothetical protein
VVKDRESDMRALTVEELGFVSGGWADAGDGNPVLAPDQTWRRILNRAPPRGLFPNLTSSNVGETLGTAIDNRGGTLGRAVDVFLDLLREQELQKLDTIINRDRDGDGITTDHERQSNWNEYNEMVKRGQIRPQNPYVGFDLEKGTS